jgi:hypothetical protein
MGENRSRREMAVGPPMSPTTSRSSLLDNAATTEALRTAPGCAAWLICPNRIGLYRLVGLLSRTAIAGYHTPVKAAIQARGHDQPRPGESVHRDPMLGTGGIPHPGASP